MKTIKNVVTVYEVLRFGMTPLAHTVSAAKEEILFGPLAATRNRKIFDTSFRSWMCNTKS